MPSQTPRKPKPMFWTCGPCGAQAVFPDGKMPEQLPHKEGCPHLQPR